jgi:hypothetical protein
LDPHGSGYNYAAGTDFPRDITVLQAESFIANETMGKAELDQGLYNHHDVFFDLSRTPDAWLACDGQPKMSIPTTVLVAGIAGELDFKYTTADGKFKSGFYIGKKDFINIGVDVVNYRNEPRTIYTITELEYLPGKQNDFVDSQTHVFPIGFCDGLGSQLSAINLRPPPDQKKFTIKSKNEITVVKDGHMVQTCNFPNPSKEKQQVALTH